MGRHRYARSADKMRCRADALVASRCLNACSYFYLMVWFLVGGLQLLVAGQKGR
jgi:hypothetical protein